MTPAYEPWAEPIEVLDLKKQDLTLFCDKPMEALFFKTKTGDFFPYLKEDIYNKINVFKPCTFLPLFQELDIPFYEEEWLRLIRVQIKKGRQLSYIFGRYLSKMKLFDFKKTSFKNSNRFFQDGYNYLHITYVPVVNFQIGDDREECN